VQGPLDVIDQRQTGVMREELNKAVEECLILDRNKVYTTSLRWSWKQAWEIFRANLVEKSKKD
jgi:hypothetical protein